MTQLLIVHPDRETKTQIREFIEEEYKDDAGRRLSTTAASHEQAAKERLAEDKHFAVICALDLPEDGCRPANWPGGWARRPSYRGPTTGWAIP